jgi:AraC-like DNA-binding protein
MIILFTGLSTLFLSIILMISNWGKPNYTKFLSLYYFFLGVYALVHYSLFIEPSIETIFYAYLHFAPALLLMSIFLFFFVKSNLANENILKNKYQYLHFVPPIIQLVLIVNYYFLPVSLKWSYARLLYQNIDQVFYLEIPNTYFYQSDSYFLRLLSLIGYSIACIVLLIKSKPFTNSDPKELRANKYRFTYIWFLTICNLFIGLGMLAVLLLLNNRGHQSLQLINSNSKQLLQFIALSMSLGLLIFPTVLYGYSPREKRLKKRQDGEDLQIDNTLHEKSKIVLDYLEDYKPYLDPNFNKSDLATKLNISQQELSNIFDLVIKLKFSDYKNKKRIEYAKDLLSKGSAKKLTMDGIGKSSGFISRSSFYAIFKAETGQTPIQYLEQFKEKKE